MGYGALFVGHGHPVVMDAVARQLGEGTLFVLACEDNLVRGASGVAVQNFNRMFGYDEAAGLL